MNKKFSTLVAGVLLATCVGTGDANAASYVKFDTKGALATSVQQSGAYQLSDKNGRVLALVRVGDKFRYEYALQMVAPANGVNLAETLWKITYTENAEGGPSFVFTSAAYGIPLSFTPKNVNSRDIIREYPGSESVWKWQKSTEVTNGNSFTYTSLVNNYSTALDSAIVVIEDVDGSVAAKRYKTSEGTGSFSSAILNLRPIEVNPVVLGADDLNSMMMTQIGAENFKLTFNDDVKGSAIGNLWTSGKLTAVEPLAVSASMLKEGEGEGDYKFNENERAAATAAKEGVDGINIPATVANVIKPSKSWDQTVQTWAKDLKAEVAAAEDLASALAILNQALEEKQDALDNTTELKAAATAISDAVGAFEMEAEVGTNYSKTVFGKSITEAATTAGITDKKLIAAFNAKVPTINNTQADFDNAKSVIAEYAKSYNVTIPSSVDKSDMVQTLAYLEGKLSADKNLLAVYKNAVTETSEKDFAKVVVSLNANAKKLATAVAKFTFKENKTKWDLDKFNAAFEAIAYNADVECTEGQFNTVKSDVAKALENYSTTVTTPTLAQSFVQEYTALYPENAAEVEMYSDAVDAINEGLDKVNSATYVQGVVNKLKNDFNAEGDAILKEIAEAVKGEDLVAAIASVSVDKYFEKETVDVTNEDKAGWVSLSLNEKDAKERDLYLAVDTNFVTASAGRRHLTFDSWYYAMPKTSKGLAMPQDMQYDYNGHFNFKFTYYPTQDSLVIVTDGYAMKPAEGVDNWVDIPAARPTYSYDGNGKTVMLAVLADNHTEVTVGMPQAIAGTKRTTLNTRIGFNANVAQGAIIPEGVYTIQRVSNDAASKVWNGRYIVANWLVEGQAEANVEDQNLNHIPAAQWMLSHENGANINTIVNRESGENLYYYQNNAYLPVQYLYSTSTDGLYTTVYGDSLKLAAVDAEALKDSTLGYYAAAKYNEETSDQLEVYALKYLNQLANVFVNYTENDSILNVSASDAAEVYFRLIPAAPAAKYGASNKNIASDLYRQAYYLQLETQNKNVKEADKLFVVVDQNGKYRLSTREVNEKGEVLWFDSESGVQIAPFFLKEFKESDTHSYALVEAWYNENDKVYELDERKVSVKDYPSILITEVLEGEMKGVYGYYMDGRTSTFVLDQKDAPKYRRLNVTDPEDGLKDNDTNIAKVYTTRNTNRYLYENTANKVAGYDENPLGVNFLGDINIKEATKNLAMFIDTAYVRNNTNRPQYMLALRPDFTPDTIPCEAHPNTHPYDLVDAVHADYLVTLTDSVAAYAKKTIQDKFRFDGNTRLAFVPAKHIGDKFIIANSIYTGTKDAVKDTIDLSKNAFVEGAWQFRLTGNEGAEFYIEGAKENNFIRLINGVAVVTSDIVDAERFNIETTTDAPTSNDAIEASEVSIIAANGSVIVKGAAGKTVAISNILGQTIANAVISSDNETIAVPAGIVVVAVEGEDAVKVVVK